VPLYKKILSWSYVSGELLDLVVSFQANDERYQLGR